MNEAQKASLTAFLNSRLDELEEAARTSKNARARAMRVPDADGWTLAFSWEADADLLLRRAGAGRELLRNWQDAVGARNRATGRHAAAAALEAERNWQDAVRLSAAIWSDHPDYDPGWKP